MSSGCRSITRWSSNLRQSKHVCCSINQRFFPPLPTTTSFNQQSVRYYAARRLKRAPIKRSRLLEPNSRNQRPPPEEVMQKRERMYGIINNNPESVYKAVRQTILDDKMSLELFQDIAKRLIDISLTHPATSESLKKIYTGDPNRVYNVGWALYVWFPWNHELFHWTADATSLAGATKPVATFVWRELNQPFTTYSTQEFKQLRVLARNEIPTAVRMQAEVFWHQKRYDEAVELMEKLQKIAYPSNLPPKMSDDVTFQNALAPPWKRLAEFYDHLNLPEKVDAMMKIGALEYQDPDALLAYAYVMKEREDWDSYERCVSVAAMAGNGDACWRLGNFYYRIYQGDIPSPDALPADASWFRSVIHNIVGIQRTPQDFRRLAIDWYDLARLHGNKQAIRNFVVLLREDGHLIDAYAALTVLEKNPKDWESPNIVKLRARFTDETFNPKIPSAWLEL